MPKERINSRYEDEFPGEENHATVGWGRKDQYVEVTVEDTEGNCPSVSLDEDGINRMIRVLIKAKVRTFSKHRCDLGTHCPKNIGLPHNLHLQDAIQETLGFLNDRGAFLENGKWMVKKS